MNQLYLMNTASWELVVSLKPLANPFPFTRIYPGTESAQNHRLNLNVGENAKNPNTMHAKQVSNSRHFSIDTILGRDLLAG